MKKESVDYILSFPLIKNPNCHLHFDRNRKAKRERKSSREEIPPKTKKESIQWANKGRKEERDFQPPRTTTNPTSMAFR